MLNKVMLIGRLGRDPESRFTNSGKQVTRFSIAVDRPRKQGETDWFQVETWGRLAEVTNQYLRKGRLVYVEGRLETGQYEHEGQTRYYTRVVASQVQMLDRPSTAEEDDLPFDE